MEPDFYPILLAMYSDFVVYGRTITKDKKVVSAWRCLELFWELDAMDIFKGKISDGYPVVNVKKWFAGGAGRNVMFRL